MIDPEDELSEADKEVLRRFNTKYYRHRNVLEYVEIYIEDLITIKRRHINIRLLGLWLIHNYLNGCDGDVTLLMEINELERKLARLDLTPFVKNEINKMLSEKRADYISSRRSKDFLTGIIEFEQAIEKYKETDEILKHAEQLIKKLKGFNAKFDAETYIKNYNFRKTCPKNPFYVDTFAALSKTPRPRIKTPKRKKGLYEMTRYELQG